MSTVTKHMSRTHMQSLLPIFFILLIAIIARIITALLIPHPMIFADSIGYFTIGKELAASTTIQALFNEFRTPLYPLLISVVARFIKNQDPLFMVITLMQSFLGIATTLLLYKTIVCVRGKRWACIGGLLYALTIPVLFWERAIMTESLALFFAALLLFSFTHIHLQKNQSYLWYGMYLLASLGGFFTRPAFLILPFLLIVWVFLSRNRKNHIMAVVITMLSFLSVIYLYSIGNYLFHSYWGIQHVGDLALWGKIFQYNLPVAETSSAFYQKITNQCVYQRHVLTPFECIDSVNPTLYTDTEKMNELQQFVRVVIKNTMLTYAKKTLEFFPTTLLNRSSGTMFPLRSIPLLSTIWNMLWHTAMTVQTLCFYGVCISIPMIVILKKNSVWVPYLFAIGIITIVQALFHAAVVYNEHDRLNIILYPFLLVWTTTVIGGIASWRKKTQKNTTA